MSHCNSREQFQKSHNASVPYPMMHHSELNISALPSALWDKEQIHWGFCEIGILINYSHWWKISQLNITDNFHGNKVDKDLKYISIHNCFIAQVLFYHILGNFTVSNTNNSDGVWCPPIHFLYRGLKYYDGLWQMTSENSLSWRKVPVSWFKII